MSYQCHSQHLLLAWVRTLAALDVNIGVTQGTKCSDVTLANVFWPKSFTRSILVAIRVGKRDGNR